MLLKIYLVPILSWYNEQQILLLPADISRSDLFLSFSFC